MLRQTHRQRATDVEIDTVSARATDRLSRSLCGVAGRQCRSCLPRDRRSQSIASLHGIRIHLVRDPQVNKRHHTKSPAFLLVAGYAGPNHYVTCPCNSNRKQSFGTSNFKPPKKFSVESGFGRIVKTKRKEKRKSPSKRKPHKKHATQGRAEREKPFWIRVVVQQLHLVLFCASREQDRPGGGGRPRWWAAVSEVCGFRPRELPSGPGISRDPLTARAVCRR